MTEPSERILSSLVEAVSDYAIYMLDPEGRVSSWNTGAERLKGYTLAEIQGQPFARFFTPEDQRAGLPQTILAEARAKGRSENEGWRVRKDGSRFWALATLHAMRDEAGELIGFAKVTRDMTERRAAQTELEASERQFRLLIDSVVDYALYMLDVNGVVTNWNRGAERIKGYRADEIVGAHFSRFYTPEDRQSGLPARALEIARREGRFAAEGWRVRKDGSRFWASVVIDPIRDEEGRLIGYAKITRDVSDQRARTVALAESERQFRMLVTGVVDYALFMIEPNGIVANWNAGAQRIKGYTADEIVGRHISQFYTAEDRAAGVPMQALRTATETGRYEAEGWRVKKDGSLFWASIVIDAIHDDDGRLTGFAKITRDITEKREAQLELQRANERLGQAQKMEALGQLTGGVAHDFNNLLMVVSGQAQLLRARLAEDARAIRALDAIEASARRGEDLTRHLLSFSRRQRLQPVALSLADRAPSLRELIAAGLPPTVRLTLDLPPDVWPVKADPSEFELAVLNLAVNARDAMPDGGALTIAARNVSLDGAGPAGLTGEFVAVAITDTGAGIAPDILARVFDPFFTTKPVDKGTGLGLSQVYGFAEQAGGRVTVESALGHGTTFTLYLPQAVGEVAGTEEAAPVGPARPARILVVEDNPEVVTVASQMLEQLGHRVQAVGNAQAALAALSEGPRPDLVFSDIVMAGDLDGLALARRLREEAPGLPVLLATGYSQSAERIGDEFPILRKPYKLAELNAAVAAALVRARAPAGDVVSLDRVRRARNGG